MISFSVLMVYRNDKLEFVRRAVESVTTEQTRKPNEVVLVVDEPVPQELAILVRDYEKALNSIFKRYGYLKNKGLGNALKVGIEAASNEIIARMDSDDVSSPDRFEKQIIYIAQHPKCDVLGGQISEFIDEKDNTAGRYIVPCKHDEVLMCLKAII